MNRPMGIVASYIDIVFKKDGQEVYRTQGALGCVRNGDPKDSYDLIRQGLAQLRNDVKAGNAKRDALDFTSVAVGKGAQKDFTRAELERAGVVPVADTSKRPRNKGPRL